MLPFDYMAIRLYTRAFGIFPELIPREHIPYGIFCMALPFCMLVRPFRMLVRPFRCIRASSFVPLHLRSSAFTVFWRSIEFHGICSLHQLLSAFSCYMAVVGEP